MIWFQNFAWAFNIGTYKSVESFREAVKKYYREIDEPFNDRILEYESIDHVLYESIVIQFAVDTDDGDFTEELVEITSDQSSFKSDELLMKINNAMYPYLKNKESVYFEYMCFHNDDDPDFPGKKVYAVFTSA